VGRWYRPFSSHANSCASSWPSSVEAGKSYALIVGFTLLAIAMNFFGSNPMQALVYSGIVHGFSTPPRLLCILLMTSNRRSWAIKPTR
jgi:Mn2+/Fe2+ NRAMP family transporter